MSRRGARSRSRRDPQEATRSALDKPLGIPPLKKLAGPDKKVVIGFPDRVKGGVQANCHRRVALPMIIEDLVSGGTPIENITLLCAVGHLWKPRASMSYWTSLSTSSGPLKE